MGRRRSAPGVCVCGRGCCCCLLAADIMLAFQEERRCCCAAALIFFKSGSRHQVKFFVDPGHIAKGDRNFVLKDASIIYKTLQRLQQHDKAPYT